MWVQILVIVLSAVVALGILAGLGSLYIYYRESPRLRLFYDSRRVWLRRRDRLVSADRRAYLDSDVAANVVDPAIRDALLHAIADASEAPAGLTSTGIALLDVYLSDGAEHEVIEQAVVVWAASAGLDVVFREEPEIGSWYRRLWVRSKDAARGPVARELRDTAVHSAELKTRLAWEAQVTATLMAQVPPLLGALQPTKDAVIRLGSVLIVKVDGAVCVTQLTAAQQLRLNHRPELLRAPNEILAALEIPAD